uniref:maturin isoform X3 n=1 Tax=Gasterosteus aculeatus aculeatus TaxID=481459 RepID=UPI001A98F57F|nr:maturin isoform X3 [Gasterosteus aculeatus aculeatus]
MHACHRRAGFITWGGREEWGFERADERQTRSVLCTNSASPIPGPCGRRATGDAPVEAADAAVRSAVFFVLSIIAAAARDTETRLRSQARHRSTGQQRMEFKHLVEAAEKWCSGNPFDLIFAEEDDERRLDFYAEPGVSFYVLCPGGTDSFLLGLPDIEDDSFEHYHADMEGEPGPDHQQMGVSQQ